MHNANKPRDNVNLHPRFEYWSEPRSHRVVNFSGLSLDEGEGDAEGYQRAPLVYRQEGAIQPTPVKELWREGEPGLEHIERDADGAEISRSGA